MAPKPRMIARNPRVLPIPFCMEVLMVPGSSPPANPTKIATRINEMNPSIFSQVVRRISRIIAMMRISMGMIKIFSRKIGKGEGICNGKVAKWKCVDVEKWKCGEVEMWKCLSFAKATESKGEVEMWKCLSFAKATESKGEVEMSLLR